MTPAVVYCSIAEVTTGLDREAVEEAVVRGSDLLKQGRIEQAQRAFRIAHELDPENPQVLALLGLTYFRTNQFAEARSVYEDLVERASTDAAHRLNLGLVYLKLGEAEKAITSLEASRAIDPSQGRAVSYLGLAYARAGRYSEAYRSFLLAGQNELASEIEINLTNAERDSIHTQLGRTPQGPLADQPATRTAASGSAPSSIALSPGRTTTPGSTAAAASVAPAPATSAAPTPSAAPSAGPTPAGTPNPPAPMLSNPEIVIEKFRPDGPAVPMVPARSGASVIEKPLFELPDEPVSEASGVPEPTPAPSMISAAVAKAEPSATGAFSVGLMAARGTRGIGPRPLTELATDHLIVVDSGHDRFELAPSGALIARVEERLFTRLDCVHVTGGDLAYEAATRRVRGHQTDEAFDYNSAPLHMVTGRGYLVAVPSELRTFSAVVLDDDILYVREDLVFAFEHTLRWENGNVPGLRGQLPVVQFRGHGAMVLQLARPLTRIKLPPQGVLFADASRLAGWVGRVIPRAVVPPSGSPMGLMCVECTGEGVVLIEPAPDRERAAAELPATTASVTAARATPPPPPAPAPAPAPPAPPEIDELKGFDEL